MSNKGNFLSRFAKRTPNKAVTQTIQKFSKSRRNVVRGLVANSQRTGLNSREINALRSNSSQVDMIAAAELLESPVGLRNRRVSNLKQGPLSKTHTSKPRSPTLEAAYACAFLNVWQDDSILAIETIEVLSLLTETSKTDALGTILAAVGRWGASNYIIKKIAFFKDVYDFNDQEQDIIDEIDKVVGNNQAPQLQFSALENLKHEISLFSVARRHTNIFKEDVCDDFRKIHFLNNIVVTPISTNDCAGFLLRSIETSLMDTVLALLVIVNLGDRFPSISQAIANNLSGEIYNKLLGLSETLDQEKIPHLIKRKDKENGNIGSSMVLYRRSSAFLEYKTYCLFRNDIDRVVGQRLLMPVLGSIHHWPEDNFNDRELLNSAPQSFDLRRHNSECASVDVFYRTYLFLRFIQDPLNLIALTSDEIKFVFNNTTGLESLLTEQELKTMHLNGSEETRALISILALSLYRSKSSDPDIDFDFRGQLENYIIKNHNGNIQDFINELAPTSPAIAHYLASSLDETTLQKMYTIVTSPSDAAVIRRDVLMTIGHHLNDIDYIIEAEAIETRTKVSKLKEYFDASRMFIDSFAMKKWLETNPSAHTEQFKEILPKVTARLAKAKNVVSSSGSVATIKLVEFERTDEYLVKQIATEAFEEFCRSNEFGIESYLGRRIRHNTLQGVMTSSVDAVLQKPEYNPVLAGTPFGRAVEEWETTFRVYIERMRRDFLQFRSDSKPNALFNSKIDTTEPVTTTNIKQLIATLHVSGAEMLTDLVIAFCWSQITPQLEIASREIRVKMAREVTQTLDQSLLRFNGPEEKKIRSELSDAVMSVFGQVASWFQVPQTGFVPASIADICNIIDIEYNRPASTTLVSGAQTNTKYFGISVHRIYDCLAVLLQNAYKHGRAGSDVEVRVSSNKIPNTNLHFTTIAVVSELPDAGREDCVSRVSAAIHSSEAASDMVTEGYSGIKKIKFITKLNEGQSMVKYQVANDRIEIEFSLKVEMASGEL